MKPKITFSVKKNLPSIFEKSKIPSIQLVTNINLNNLYIRNFWFWSNWRRSFFLQPNIFPFIWPPSRIFHSWNQIMSYKSGNFTSDRFPKLFPPPGLKDKWLTSHLCFEDFPHKACISQNRQYAWNVWNGMLKSSTFLKNMVSHQNFVFIFVFLDSSWNFSLEKWYNTCI